MVTQIESKFIELGAKLPDIPRWIDARSLLLSGRCEIYGFHNNRSLNFALRNCDFPLICVVGEPSQSAIQQAISAAGTSAEILATPENCHHINSILRNWQKERAILHNLKQPIDSVERIKQDVKFVSEDELLSLRTQDPELANELLKALSYAPIAAALYKNQPVSFCYAAEETETLWDISIDTLKKFQRKGFAQKCLKFMLRYMLKKGKQPVWGAVESNLTSLRLAEKLGFEVMDELYLFS